ncbi:hypothetical protein [uncultured Bacteroides sp.]|nr:hypothetical protein [uncultured Bacteroides sp.]
MALAVSVSMASCSDDDEGSVDSGSLVGTWEVISNYSVVDCR